MTTESEERATAGLHAFVLPTLLRWVPPGACGVDLGAGSGAFLRRLGDAGLSATGVDREPPPPEVEGRWRQLDLDGPFADELGPGVFGYLTAIEVIEHLENPIEFLRQCRRLLIPSGVAVLTTPNVDNLPARLKFALTGRLRMMDSLGDPTHISPIHLDLLRRLYLPRAGLRLVQHLTYPPDDFVNSRTPVRLAARTVALALSRGREALLGDNHVFVLRPTS